MTKFAFVGEEPSEKAKKMGVEWKDGRLAAKQLFDALRENGIEPMDHFYTNWFTSKTPANDSRHYQKKGFTVVALGNKVSSAMSKAGIVHLRLVHPAARGKIRLKANYSKHVGEVLGGKP